MNSLHKSITTFFLCSFLAACFNDSSDSRGNVNDNTDGFRSILEVTPDDRIYVDAGDEIVLSASSARHSNGDYVTFYVQSEGGGEYAFYGAAIRNKEVILRERLYSIPNQYLKAELVGNKVIIPTTGGVFFYDGEKFGRHFLPFQTGEQRRRVSSVRSGDNLYVAYDCLIAKMHVPSVTVESVQSCTISDEGKVLNENRGLSLDEATGEIYVSATLATRDINDFFDDGSTGNDPNIHRYGIYKLNLPDDFREVFGRYVWDNVDVYNGVLSAFNNCEPGVGNRICVTSYDWNSGTLVGPKLLTLVDNGIGYVADFTYTRHQGDIVAAVIRSEGIIELFRKNVDDQDFSKILELDAMEQAFSHASLEFTPQGEYLITGLGLNGPYLLTIDPDGTSVGTTIQVQEDVFAIDIEMNFNRETRELIITQAANDCDAGMDCESNPRSAQLFFVRSSETSVATF